jgi:hypothetical protein
VNTQAQNGPTDRKPTLFLKAENGLTIFLHLTGVPLPLHTNRLEIRCCMQNWVEYVLKIIDGWAGTIDAMPVARG